VQALHFGPYVTIKYILRRRVYFQQKYGIKPSLFLYGMEKKLSLEYVPVSEPSTSGNSHFKKQSTEEPVTETGSSVVRTQGGGMKTERVTEETAVICNHC
jgi:hypothetical protein